MEEIVNQLTKNDIEKAISIKVDALKRIDHPTNGHRAPLISRSGINKQVDDAIHVSGTPIHLAIKIEVSSRDRTRRSTRREYWPQGKTACVIVD